MHGQGRLHVKEAIYEGTFNMGKFEGQGVIHHGGDWVWEGEFLNGKQHGRGVYSKRYYESTHSQDGEWKNGKRQYLYATLENSVELKEPLEIDQKSILPDYDI